MDAESFADAMKKLGVKKIHYSHMPHLMARVKNGACLQVDSVTPFEWWCNACNTSCESWDICDPCIGKKS